MGAAAVPIMIATTVASGAMQYSQGKNAAKAAENEGKRAADQEAAQQREEGIERRERLIRALSAQTAASGASGTKLSGSSLNIMEEDQRQFEQEDFRARLSGRSKADAIRASGKNRAKSHRMGANISLIDTASKVGAITAADFNKPNKPKGKS